MAKRADVELRIKSKNLASKDLGELNAELDKLVKNQEKQASSASLATRSLRDLNTQQRELSKISDELSRRRSVVESLIGKQADLNAAKGRVNELRKELAELLAMKSKGTFLGDIDAAIKNVKKELGGADKIFDRTAKGVDKLADRLKETGVDTEDLAGSLKTITSASNRAKAAVIDQTTAVGRLGKAQEEAARDTRKLAEAQRFVADQSKRTQGRRADAAAGFAGLDEYNKQKAAIAASTAALARQGVEVARVQGIHDRFNAVLARNANAQREFVNQTDKGAAAASRQASASARQTAAVERIQTIHDKFAEVVARNAKHQRALATATDQGTGAVNRQSTGARNARGSMDRYGKSVGDAASRTSLLADTGRKSLSVYQRIRGEVLSLAAAYVGVFQAVNLFKSAITVSQKRLQLNAQILRVAGGNARYAAEEQKFLRQEADRLGLTYDDLAEKYANFAISAKAAGISTARTRKAFSQASEIVVGAFLSPEDSEGVFRAFIQIFSKARVQAEELRGQLGDRLPGAVAEFGNSLIKLGKIKSLSELDKYLVAGKANMTDFLQFLEDYAASVQGGVKAGSQTVFAQINRLKTAYNDFLASVAESGTSDELSKAVTSLTTALKGDAGKKFAGDLATAFAHMLKTLQFVIANFDTFLTLAKAFIAFQIAKGFFGIGLALTDTAKNFIGAAKAARGFYTAAVAAKTAGAGLTLGMRGLLLLLGPVGIALAAVASALYVVQGAAAAADARMASFTATMRAAGKATNTMQATEAADAIKVRLDESTERLRELRQLQEDSTKWAPGKQLSSAIGLIKNDLYTTGALQAEITSEMSKQNAYQSAMMLLAKKKALFTEREAAEDKARSEQEAAAAKAMAEGLKDPKKGPKPPSAKQLRAEADSRANASRALAKEILDLDQAIFDARIDGEARTAEQVAKNYELTIRKIESQMEEQQLGLDRLEQNARSANAGNLTAADAASLQVAKERLEILNLSLNAKAMEMSTLAEVTIGERKVNDLLAERDAKIAAINTEVELGLKTEVEGRREALALQQQYGALLETDIRALITLLQELPPDLFARLGAAKMIADLGAVLLKAKAVKTELQLIGENLGGQFATGAAAAFGTLAKGIAGFLQGTNSIGDAFRGAADAFQSFLADFLVGIGQAIMQAIILKAIMNALNGTSGGYIDAAMGALGGSNHDGGIVGQDGKARWMPASALKRAKRFHDGGLPGLKANEVPTILERGEEVLTADDPRHVLNGGSGGGPPVNIEVVNAIDSPSVVSAGLSDKATRQTFYNYMRADKNQIKQLLGIRG